MMSMETIIHPRNPSPKWIRDSPQMIRRAALIALFSIGNKEMLACKTGNWWELNPQRGRANNSAVVVRSRVSKNDFYQLWEYIKASGSGEPGISWTNNPEYGFNPCHEISLQSEQFCNLTEINVSNIESQEDLNNRVKAATIIGTLQASYVDFHYLRDTWKRNCEKDALLGVSMTGIASMNIFDYNIEEAAKLAVSVNKKYAEIIGINPAARITTVKPAGTTSLVLGTSSGIHAWHDKYYWRRMRINKNESLYTYLSLYHPELLEDDYFNPETTSVITIPQKSPDGSVTREESALDLLNRVHTITDKWVKPGFNSGYNQHNVSCTVSIKEDEWDEVANWMWINRDVYSGIAILPYSGHSYKQAPFESCTEEEYNEASKYLEEIDLTKVIEIMDNTNLQGELACSGGNCEVK